MKTIFGFISMIVYASIILLLVQSLVRLNENTTIDCLEPRVVTFTDTDTNNDVKKINCPSGEIGGFLSVIIVIFTIAFLFYFGYVFSEMN